MTVTVFFDEREVDDVAGGAREDGERLWLSPEALAAASGWVLKPEGLCKEDACVPLPRDGSWLDDAGRVDVTAFAQRFDRPVVRDEEHSVWAFGESAGARREALSSVEAPDFTLPDLDGRMHSLSDYRGRKVFLLSWGSY
jgi:hypothetical protein